MFLYSTQLQAYVPSEGNITASFGLFLYKTNFSGTDQLPSSPILGDFSFITNGDLNDVGSLEIGLLHMNKIYYRNLKNNDLAEKTELIQISMGYRRWLNEVSSIGLGFYGAYSLGDYKIMHSDSNIDLEIDTSARDTIEYGLDLSFQNEIWHQNDEAVTVDLRYAYSISNKENEKGDHYGVLLGYRRVIQEKNSKVNSSENK